MLFDQPTKQNRNLYLSFNFSNALAHQHQHLIFGQLLASFLPEIVFLVFLSNFKTITTLCTTKSRTSFDEIGDKSIIQLCQTLWIHRHAYTCTYFLYWSFLYETKYWMHKDIKDKALEWLYTLTHLGLYSKANVQFPEDSSGWFHNKCISSTYALHLLLTTTVCIHRAQSKMKLLSNFLVPWCITYNT